jgi:hypothetical protein
MQFHNITYIASHCALPDNNKGPSCTVTPRATTQYKLIALKDYIAIIQTMPQHDNIMVNHDRYTCDELYEILTSTDNLDPENYDKNTSNMFKILIIDDHVRRFHDGLYITCRLDLFRESLIDTTKFYYK